MYILLNNAGIFQINLRLLSFHLKELNILQFRGCKAEIFKRSLSNTVNDEKKKFLDAAYNKAKEQAKPKNNPNQKFVVFGSTIGITALVSFSIYKLASQKLSDAKENMVIYSDPGRPDIGGDWNLVDFDGKPASNKDLEGHWIIYYFGFTQCPDICPEEMSKIAKMNDILKSKHKLSNLIPVFISVDPDRDDSSTIKSYVKRYSPDFLGFTGNPDQIALTAKRFRIFYSKGAADKLGNYQVDHSIVSYLFDPNGNFSDYFTKSDSIMDRVNKVLKRIKKQSTPSKKSSMKSI